jgi:hypothetical protein
MKEVPSLRPPMDEVLFPRTPEVGDSREAIVAQIELTRWAVQTLHPVAKQTSRSSHSAEFNAACIEAQGASKHYIEHYSESGFVTRALKEEMTWRES